MHNKLLKKLAFLTIFAFVIQIIMPSVLHAQSVKSSKTLPIIKEIIITGSKKIEKEAIIARLISKVGEAYSEKNIAEDIKTVFKMGFFLEIEVSKDDTQGGVSLEYKVVEKPTVSEIIFEGNEDVKTEDLETQIPIKPYEILNHAKIKESVVKLEKYYEEKGFYLVKIEPVVEEVKTEETVKLKFSITESDKVKVKKITIIGNNKLKDSYLKPLLLIKEAGFFSGMSSSGAFKQEAFERDIAALKFIYWNQGYIEVKVDRPLITVTPDKKSIYITYHIEEGEQFNVGEIDFTGDLLFDKSELMQSVKIKDNGIFSVEVMQKDIADLQSKYGDLGYAFTNVIPRYDVVRKDRIVNLVFDFEKGNKVYFGTINVVNNSKTRDKVVRRELKIREGELYNETRKRLSQENIQRLGFFEEVNFKTSTPPERPDELNIDIVVKERNTGQLQLTAGYGNIQGLSIGGSIQQNNFRGLGQTLGARIDATKNRQDYSLSLTEPYIYDSLWSAGFDVFYTENKERINYDNRVTGAAVRFGHPIWGDDVRAYIRYKLDKTDLFANDYTDPLLFPLSTARGTRSSATLTLEYDTRNDRFTPSKGVLADISYEFAGLGGDLKYQELSTHLRFYKNVFLDVVWRNNLAFSMLQSLNDNEVPFTQRYQMGGAYTLRGFGSGTVGRRLFSQYRYNQIGTNDGNPFYAPGISEAERQRRSNLIFGGTKQMIFQTEMQYPLIKEAGLNGVFFYDIGQAEDEIINTKFVSDIGLGFRWQSPLGLLRFEWGYPVNSDDLDRDSVNFEFSIGPPF
ncbi:outer membrane protein assembly factor BamA [bacterium]|nr:outer membrane protein assembly factor BamA [bacterium]